MTFSDGNRDDPPSSCPPLTSQTCILEIHQRNIALAFYVPRHYKRHLKRYRDVYDIKADHNERGYPVVVNFPGGGFTFGGPEDDARRTTAVVSITHAIVYSVHY
jgi:acetyl esterase/lipase